jgi:diguanylate cyclase (GGDEF)-like protein
MRLERQLFDSRLARRVFASFLIASLVPLLVLSFLLLREVGQALEDQAFEQLENTTRSYGQFTLDKLLAATDTLRDAPTSGSSAAFDAMTTVEHGRQRSLLGEWAPPVAAIALDADKPSLAVTQPASGLEVVIAQPSRNGAVYARIGATYLPDTMLDAGMQACVLSATLAAPIRCATPIPDVALARILSERQERSAGRFTWTDESGEWLATYWQLFLPSRFNAEPWTVVVSQPRSTALASLAIFNRIVPQAVIATLVLIALLAIAQIRRTLNPLKELLAATKRIAAQEFSKPVRIGVRDEFAQLGDALNAMAQQLDQQFGALRALAEIDRSILQTTDIEPVLDTLFARLDRLAPDTRNLVLVIDGDNEQHGRVYQGDRARHGERVKVTPALRQWLHEIAPERTIAIHELVALGFDIGADHGAAEAFVVPIITGETVSGALVVIGADSALPGHARESVRELMGRVAVAISAGKREAELFRRAHFDALTTLPNRELLHDRLRQAVAHAQREEHQLAVLFVDLDGFKEINDRFGHRGGDDLLQDTALRLTGVLRPGDTVARLGGDEYAIVLPQIHGALAAEAVAIKAIETLRRPFAVDGHEAYLSASIGLALFPDDGTTAAELLRRADMAMYTAKEAGKGCHRFFAEEMDRRLQERHSLHHDLRAALAADQFSLAYQPQVDMRTGQFVSAEALLRWQHPTRGLVSPGLFIPILEEMGLIKEVGAWVLRKALADFAGWQRSGIGFSRVAVNISARQLLDREFADDLAKIVAAAGLAGRHLEIELTEASLVDDFRRANDALAELRAHGIRVALDDFGTGYSSLAYLNELAFDTLKIDRAFVVNLPADKSVAIVKAIIAVANTLGKKVVGYLIAKPLSVTELIAWASSQDWQATADETARRRASGGRA